MSVDLEIKRRLDLWDQVNRQEINNLDPGLLRSLRIFGGAQGIWVDKAATKEFSEDNNGVTVSVLHTGRHYPDDLSDEGMFYHYPSTNRLPSRDQAEIDASKNAGRLGIPIFVILPGIKSTSRTLKIGWVESWDDDEKIFLIMFGEERPDYIEPQAEDEPFNLKQREKQQGKSTTKTRPNQMQFRHHVMTKYGFKCAVCNIEHRALIQAAHICGVVDNGSDDWRNGIPLCGTHHLAFDEFLFCFSPDDLGVKVKSGVSASSISITEPSMNTKKDFVPHDKSILWRYKKTKKLWGN